MLGWFREGRGVRVTACVSVCESIEECHPSPSRTLSQYSWDLCHTLVNIHTHYTVLRVPTHIQYSSHTYLTLHIHTYPSYTPTLQTHPTLHTHCPLYTLYTSHTPYPTHTPYPSYSPYSSYTTLHTFPTIHTIPTLHTHLPFTHTYPSYTPYPYTFPTIYTIPTLHTHTR